MAAFAVSDVWETLEAQHLLTEEQCRDARTRYGQTSDSRAIANQLVSDGWLTSWQARQLLAGSRHFRLGPYVLLDVIGRGGTSTVFKARHDRLGQTVALKVLSPDCRSNPAAVAMFLREAQIAKSLDHPNLISTVGVEIVDGSYALVSEYASGGSLRDWSSAYHPLPVGWACDWACQAATGLQFLWESGVVHRDIKPGNLLLAVDEFRDPTVKILDLGISRLLSEREDGGRRTPHGSVGTPDYVAPEQIELRGEVDIRADLFSLGCTLYELLTGCLPFGGQTVREKIAARLLGDAPRVGEQRTGISDDLNEIVAKLLARNPDERFQTPAEVAQALAPFQQPFSATDFEQMRRGLDAVQDEITSVVLLDDSQALVGNQPTHVHLLVQS